MGGLYAASYDPANRPPKGRKARKQPPPPPVLPPNLTLQAPAEPPTPTTREEIRRRQLTARTGAKQWDQAEDVRRKYETQHGKAISEPQIRGPQERTQVNHLSDEDLAETEDDLDLETVPLRPTKRMAAPGEPLTEPTNPQPEPQEHAIPTTNEDLKVSAVDRTLSDAFRAVKNLQTAVGALNAAMGELNPTKALHAERMASITNEAVIPWLNEIDNHLKEFVATTNEATNVP